MSKVWTKEQHIEYVKEILTEYWIAFYTKNEKKAKEYKDKAKKYYDEYDLDNMFTIEEYRELQDFKLNLKHRLKGGQ